MGSLCRILDELHPRPSGEGYEALISFVVDRPGHDLRYAISNEKILRQTSWRPRIAFETGLRDTVRWYLSNQRWSDGIRDTRYRGVRLGLRAMGNKDDA